VKYAKPPYAVFQPDSSVHPQVCVQDLQMQSVHHALAFFVDQLLTLAALVR
jgi:hypothetical protein